MFDSTTYVGYDGVLRFDFGREYEVALLEKSNATIIPLAENSVDDDIESVASTDTSKSRRKRSRKKKTLEAKIVENLDLKVVEPVPVKAETKEAGTQPAKGFRKAVSTQTSLKRSPTTNGKKDQQQPRDSDSNMSVYARIEGLEKLVGDLLIQGAPAVPSDRLLQSGLTPPQMPMPSENLSFCKPQEEFQVQILTQRFTRKQEKLYNKICHLREFQQVLRRSTNQECLLLRKRALMFATSPLNAKRNPQAQDFLVLCLHDLTRSSLQDMQGSSLERC